MRPIRPAALAALAGALIAAAPAAAATESRCDVPIRMSDGVTLRANVFLPAGAAKAPVLLQTTGYNKDVFYAAAGSALGGAGSAPSGPGSCSPPNPDLVDAGYAEILLDDRGTGASEGSWDSWGARTQQDYGEVLDWIQAQPWSDGRVGTYGASYMGITSLLVAEADAERVRAGKPRAVDAVWADVPMADAYRDVTFHGGAVDAGFMPFWLGLTSSLSDLPPSTIFEDPAAAAQTWAGHLANTWGFAGQKLLNVALGTDDAYDGPFYRLRSPIERVKQLTVPVAITGGWWDIFQRGEPLLYEQMTSSPERKLWMSEGYHLDTGGKYWDQQGIGTREQVMTRWFDHWLRGTDNGVQNLPPVNLYTLGSGSWSHYDRWPLPGTRYSSLYLDGAKSGSAASLNDGTLVAKPPAVAGADTAPLLPASSPCSRLTAQWTAGAAGGTPCDTDDRSFEATSLTWTSAPLARDTQVTGPIAADLHAEISSKDATLVAVLSDVDPSGSSTEISAGFLLASQRAVDSSKSTFIQGLNVRPWHPFTRQSQQPVEPNQPAEYQIEIYPTSNVFRAGHRIRLTLATANTPGTLTPLPDQLNELGGQIRLLHGPRYPSRLLLPLVPAGSR